MRWRPRKCSPGVRRLQRRASRRGVALIMVLGALTVLTVFLTDLQEETTSELSAALSERDALRAEYLARSAVNLSRLLIATEPTIRKNVQFLGMAMGMKTMPQLPVWEFSDMVLGPFNDEAASLAFGALAGLDTAQGKNLGLGTGGSFVVKIVDEDSKINANAAARAGDILSRNRFGAQMVGLIGPQQYNSLFEGRDLDDQFSDRATICGAIVDWSDSDEELYGCDVTSTSATARGSEDSFYQVIGMDYRRKNAAFDSLEELRLVRGMGDDFWATFVDPEPGDPKKRIMTVWGQGTVNVNTANPQTLLAIICANAVEGTELCVDPVQMETFLMTVGLAKSVTMGAPLFTTPKNFVAVIQGKGSGLAKMFWELSQLKPVVLKSATEFAKQVSTESKLFSIYAEGIAPGPNKRQTRVRVQTVVDFRNALELGEAFPGLPNSQNPDPAAAAQNQAASALTPEALTAMMTQNPAGTVVYWRVE